MKLQFTLFSCLFLFTISCVAADIDSNNLKKHISYLASDKLKGRAPGTKGEELAAKYIADNFKTLGIAPKGEEGYFQYFEYRQSKNPHDTSHSEGKRYRGKNVVGYLDNGAPKTIVIGAHYDHLGTDGRGSSLEKKAKGKIHNGADDNASGTAGVIELARYFSSNNRKESVNFLFMCYSAEEAGLIGSKYFTRHPSLPLENIHSMINMDMIGRLSDSTNKLLVYGVGTSDVFVPLLDKLNQYNFELVKDSSGIGPSDQTSFYLKKIPVLHFFTGQHADYHKSTDDIEKINFAGEQRVLVYIKDVIEALSNLPELKFFETKTKDTGKSSFKVTLGVMPDYGYQGKGLRIDAVNKDKPAERAGIKDGDIVIKMGDTDINNIYDYMKALSLFSKGQSTSVILLRNSQTLTVTVTF